MKKIVTTLLVIAACLMGITFSNKNLYAKPIVSTAPTSSSKENQPTGEIVIDSGPLSGNNGWLLTNNGLWNINTASGQWKQIKVPTKSIAGVSAIDNAHIWIITSDDIDKQQNPFDLRIYFTNDTGNSWESSSLYPIGKEDWYPSISPEIKIKFIDRQFGWVMLKQVTSAAFNVGFLFRTTDGGKTWEKYDSPSGSLPYFIDQNNGWVADDRRILHHTSDGGMTWSETSLPNNFQQGYWTSIGESSYINGKSYIHTTLLAETQVIDLLYLSEDKGSSWQEIGEIRDDKDKASIILINDTEWIAFYPHGKSKISMDNGKSWKEDDAYYASDKRVFSSIQQISSQNAWVSAQGQFCEKPKEDCTQYSAIYETNNGGHNWKPVIDYTTHSDKAK